MATEKTNALRCQLCPQSVEHHCNFCRVDLCSSCIPKHVADKTRKHEVVEFINKKERLILPECKSHELRICETYCKDCHEPTCALCITGKHRKHDFTDIDSITKHFKQRIIVDMTKLDNMLHKTQYKNPDEDKTLTLFDDALSAIKEHEEMICKKVCEISCQLKIEVEKQKKHHEDKYKTMQSLAEKTNEELREIIEIDESILQSNDAAKILNYQPRNEMYKDWPKDVEHPYVKFLPGPANQNELQNIFGKIQLHDITSKKAWYNPSLLGTSGKYNVQTSKKQ